MDLSPWGLAAPTPVRPYTLHQTRKSARRVTLRRPGRRLRVPDADEILAVNVLRRRQWRVFVSRNVSAALRRDDRPRARMAAAIDRPRAWMLATAPTKAGV